MKNTSIKSIKQLPSWFKLEKYQKAKYFNSSEWYEKLIPRLLMRKKAERPLNNLLDLHELWDFIKKDGLLFYSAHKQNISYRIALLCPEIQVLKEIDKKNDRLPHEFLSIASLANLYVYMTYWLLEIPEREKIVERIRELFKGNGSRELAELTQGEAAEWASKPFDDFPSDVVIEQKNKFAYARIKLEASDEQIKKDFAMWLDYERTRRKCPAPKKNFSEVELDSWHETAILPYLDLMFWSAAEDVKITQYAIAQAIFPEAYSIDSDIDPLGKLKTTKKKAEYLMNYETMELLESQITD